MRNYFLRRLLYLIPILIGVNVLTFLLFFVVNTPDDVARMQLGAKHVTEEAVVNWKQTHGYDKPLWFNDKAQGLAKWTDTLFVSKSLSLFQFKFGVSNRGRSISREIFERMGPSLALAIPALLLAMLVNVSLALTMVFFRGSWFDRVMVVVCIMMMSISGLFYIIAGQYWIGKVLKLVPLSGYLGGWDSFRFLMLPVLLALISSLGPNVRWYRTILLEESGKGYMRTAFAKGLSPMQVYARHLLRNGLIPIITRVVALIPLLFLGSLLLESFFGIPGLGSFIIDAIGQQDFEIVRSMVFLGTLLYLVGLMLTDLAYVWADPRIRLE